MKEALRMKKENEENLVKMEEKMVAKLDKEFEDKMAALAKERQERRSDISDKVKVKQERQVQVNQRAAKKLANEHNVARDILMFEMWRQSDKQDAKQGLIMVWQMRNRGIGQRLLKK